MADELPSLHIDTDWKKQAQEEKRKIIEEEQKRNAERAATPPPVMPATAPPLAGPASAASESPRGRAVAGRERGIPQASFATLVSSISTQVLLYLGELTPRGVEPQVNLDLAKFNVDLLAVLEEKTNGNLSPEEQKLLDGALYEVRMRYVSVASQYATV